MSKKKKEFSKLIFVGVSVGVVAITVLSFVLMFKTGDLSPLSYLIPAAFAELATATGFYYNKAKIENEIKLKVLYGIELDDDDFSEPEPQFDVYEMSTYEEYGGQNENI